MFSLRCMIQSEVNGLVLFFNVSLNENFGINEFIQFFIQLLDLQIFLLYNRLAITVSCTADTGFDVTSRRGPATSVARSRLSLARTRSPTAPNPVEELSLRHRLLPRGALPQIHENVLLWWRFGNRECVALGLEGLSGWRFTDFQKKKVRFFAVAVALWATHPQFRGLG